MKRLLILFAVCMLLLLAACSAKTVGENTLKTDIMAYDEDLQDSSLTVTEFTIVKRQTNREEKNDLVYINIKAKNEEYEVERSYKMTYLLYNDGWKLETVEPFTEGEYKNNLRPLKAVDQKTLEHYTSLDYYASKESSFALEDLRSWKYDYELTNYALKEHDGPHIGDVNSYDIYYYTVEFTYPTLTETVVFSVRFDFLKTKDNGWCWAPQFGDKVDKKVAINSGILGEWTSNYLNSDGQPANDDHTIYEISITDYGDNWFYIDSCKQYSLTWSLELSSHYELEYGEPGKVIITGIQQEKSYSGGYTYVVRTAWDEGDNRDWWFSPSVYDPGRPYFDDPVYIKIGGRYLINSRYLSN